ncbi:MULTISPECIES: hypothetical protein [Empedobacter]|uniref:Uncharacterized protein n=3 Tax=Pseudomonadati TaxID=3379134 RepID=A0A7H9DSF5_9FLAO|nr:MULTISPECIES: hypothetical protein [Empedobacter]QLL58000.1 hypothetical protein FH779_07870 [Empedobacter falsenii]
MKKTLLSLIFLGLTWYVNAQVGVGTNDPKATLDVRKSTNTPTTSVDGVIPPNMTKTELANKAAGTYAALQTGALVYVSDVTGGASGASLSQVVQITSSGYYTFNGTVWIKLLNSTDADTTNDAWVNNSANTRVELGTTSNGVTRVAGTEVVATDAGNLGLGIVAPTTKLHVVSGGTTTTPLSAVTINDGTQALNRVLTSDNNGVAKWSEVTVSKVRGVMRPANSAIQLIGGGAGVTTNNNTISLTTTVATIDKIHLGSYIDLDPGKWEVEANVLVNLGLPASVAGLNYVFNKFTFTEETTAVVVNQSGDLPLTSESGWLIGGSTVIFGGSSGSTDAFYAVINGKVFITNTSTAKKRYYLTLWQGSRKYSNYSNGSTTQAASATISITGLGSSANGENYITAQKIN